MRAAAIDVGSNTLRMLIGDIHGDVLSRLHSDRAVTRLAEGTRDSGVLKEENMKNSLSVLRDFSSVIKQYKAGMVSAVGTSALRDAKNSGDFIDAVFLDTGIRIMTISGMREAELTAKGILLGFGKTRNPFFIIDVGGGSTEWIVFEPGHEMSALCGSLRIGVINLFERFVKSDPPSSDNVDALCAEADLQLSNLNIGLRGRLPSGPALVGTGGTVTTLASIDLGLKTYDAGRVHMRRIHRERLEELRDLLLRLPLSERQKIDGLDPERADLIIPGILLTIKLMDFFGFGSITVSDYGLLEGLLKEADE